MIGMQGTVASDIAVQRMAVEVPPPASLGAVAVGAAVGAETGNVGRPPRTDNLPTEPNGG